MSNEELTNIVGGKISFVGIITGALTFIIGLIDGILRPLVK